MLSQVARLVQCRRQPTRRSMHDSRTSDARSGSHHAPSGTGNYKKQFERSIKDPEGFWGEAASKLVWTKKWDSVLDSSKAPIYRWFQGGQLNAAYNALDRHLKTRPDQKAIIYDSPLTNTIESYTYADLHARVERFAGVLRDQGVEKGDVVLIYMPMIPQAVVAMLACARIGAIHTVVFGGFASEQLAIRINHAQPKVILTASCGVEPTKVIPYKPLIDAAIDRASWKPQSIIVYQRKGHGVEHARANLTTHRPSSNSSRSPSGSSTGPHEFDWEALENRAKAASHVSVAATDPLYMLYTSGTTGTPKAILRDTGGYCTALNWSIENIFNLEAGDTIFTASDVGWVVGHTYIVYAPLIAGLTSILYEGKPTTPDAGAFWRAIEQHRVNAFFTAPTAYRTLKREDFSGEQIRKHDVSSLKSLWIAGEHADPNTIEWLQHHFPGVPVVDNAWQTETGWPITANPLGIEEHPVKPGSSCRPMPGYDLRVLKDDGSPSPCGELGNLAIKLPLPPGTLPSLFKNDDGYIKSYLSQFPGYYNTGDAGCIDEDGYVYFMARTDDIINVSGIRLSTGAIEEIVSEHPDVAECAVVGAKDELRGQVPVGLIVVKTGEKRPVEAIVKEVMDSVRTKISAVAQFRACIAVNHLPKTRSGKILRKTIKQIADGEAYVVPGTIDNPATIDTITIALKKAGFPPQSNTTSTIKRGMEAERKAL